MPRKIIELQDAASHATTSTKKRVRYDEEEWQLLAKAMLTEMQAKPEHIGLSIVQLANQAQHNQKEILRSDIVDPNVDWTYRHFTAVNQLTRVLIHLHKLLLSQLETSELLKLSSDENVKNQARINDLEQKLKAITTKEPSFADFASADIIAEAAFIQASWAEKLEKTATEIKASQYNITTELANMKTELILLKAPPPAPTPAQKTQVPAPVVRHGRKK